MTGLPVVPLRERVVEIEAALATGSAERYRYGSGYRLGGRLVLTAAHVVAENALAGITVRGPDKVPHPARVVDGLVGDPEAVDLALVELCDEIAELPSPLVAAVERNAPVPFPVEGCWTVGYPLFQEVESAAGVVRETAQVWGMILPAENLVSGLLSLQVTSAPRPLPPRQEALGASHWSGMSGAAVLAGDRLIGVVSEHATRRGESTITVTPLANLGRLPAAAAARWWAYLDADPEHLVMLPARRGRAEPEYRAALRRLRAHTLLQGRGKELAEIGAFATGRPSALAQSGSQHAWLVGGPWAGKTALLAEAVHALPPEVDCVAYFLTRPNGDADHDRFLAAVVPQLAWLLGTDRPSVTNEYVLWQLWEEAAQRAHKTGRHLLLIVDGLDEDLLTGGHSVAGCLPGRLPGLPARVLVASRPYPQRPNLHPRLPDDVDLAHPLAAFKPDQLYTLPDSTPAARQRDLAEQEITQLLRRTDDDLALKVLGFLTAARGPLSVADLEWLTGSPPWKVRRVIDGKAARTLQQVGPTDMQRYSFAHETLLDRCQQEGIGHPGHALRIREWAATWRDLGWPAARDGKEGAPLYLLDTYPQVLRDNPALLAALVGDAGWVNTAIRTLGVDAVLAELKTAGAAAPSGPRLAAMHAVVRGQAHHLRGPEAVGDPGFVPRQLCLQAAELGETLLADDCRTRQLACDNPGPVLRWTTRRASQALALELRCDKDGVSAMAALPDGRVVTGGRRVLVWDPTKPGTPPVELGHDKGWVKAMAALPDGRVVTGGDVRDKDGVRSMAVLSGEGADRGGRVLVWDPTEPGFGPVELGRDKDGVSAMVALPDGRVVTGGRRVLVWDPTKPGTPPVELGRDKGWVKAMAALPDERVVTGSASTYGGRVLVWNPAEPGTPPVELGHDNNSVWAMAALPDGRVVTSTGTGSILSGGRFLVWNPAEPGTPPVELGRDNDLVQEMAALPDGRVVTGSETARGGVLVWNPAEPGTGPVELGRDKDGVQAMAVLPDGRVVTGAGGASGRLMVWDPGATPRGPVEFSRGKDGVRAMAVLPDGRVVTGGGRVLVWDPTKPGTPPVELGHDKYTVWAVTVLPDGRVVTGSGGVHGGGRVLVWDPAEPGAGPVELGHDKYGVRAMAALPNGRVVTGSGDLVTGGRVLVWDPAEPGTPPVELGHDKYGVRAVTALPDGRVVTGSGSILGGGGVLVWDPTEPGAGPVELGRDARGVSAVAVLPDGRVVTGSGSATEGGRLLVWDPAEPGAGPVEICRDERGVSAVAVLPDGRVVTNSGDLERVLVRNTQSNPPVTLLAYSAYALATSLSPSGASLLFIGHMVGGISCWEVRPAKQDAPEAR